MLKFWAKIDKDNIEVKPYEIEGFTHGPFIAKDLVTATTLILYKRLGEVSKEFKSTPKKIKNYRLVPIFKDEKYTVSWGVHIISPDNKSKYLYRYETLEAAEAFIHGYMLAREE